MIFHDVEDVVITMIEPAKDRGAVATPHIVRTAQTHPSVLEIIPHNIRNVQMTPNVRLPSTEEEESSPLPHILLDFFDEDS